jgi:hypothetical protein
MSTLTAREGDWIEKGASINSKCSRQVTMKEEEGKKEEEEKEGGGKSYA